MHFCVKYILYSSLRKAMLGSSHLFSSFIPSAIRQLNELWIVMIDFHLHPALLCGH